MKSRFSICYGSARVGQFEIAGMGRITPAELAKRLIDRPLKPSKPQKSCDLGLFSDEACQLDLVTLANHSTGEST